MSTHATASQLHSAVYEGIVRHRRRDAYPHSFGYRVAHLLLDLSEIEIVFANRRYWSVGRPNLAEFRRSDYLGPPEQPLTFAVRSCVELATGSAPTGPVRLLTHARYGGYLFNPVSFYYCYEADGITLHSIVAEITNTWKERHCYVLPLRTAIVEGWRIMWSFDKSFHVSPFLAMDRQYVWTFSPPGDSLYVNMDVHRDAQHEFDATLALQRRPLDGRSLNRVLWRYPFM